MSIPATLLAIETDLRRTVSEGGFRQTPELFQRYMQQLESEVRRIPPGSNAARELEARATALLDWIRTMASVSLAHCAAELERLPYLAPFGNPQPRHSQTAVDA
jgi:hypothetical protein